MLFYTIRIDAVVMLFSTFSASAATTFFDANSLIEDGDVYDNVVVTGDGTVIDMKGGDATGSFFIYDSNIVNISNGEIAGTMFVYSSSTVNISGGQLKEAKLTHDNSIINISGQFLRIS